MKIVGLRRGLVALSLLVGLFLPQLATAQPILTVPLENYMRQLITQYKDLRVGVAVGEVATGRTIYSFSADDSLTPASVQKLALTLASLKALGADYKFPTEVFVDRLPASDPAAPNGDCGNLYLRPYGDPGFVDEQLWLLVREIKSSGVTALDNVIVDDSLFIDPPPREGPNPYQAALSAAALNYNSYWVQLAPGALGQKARAALEPGLPFELVNEVVTAKETEDLDISEQEFPAPKIEKRLDQVTPAGLKEFSEPRRKVIVKGRLALNSKPVRLYHAVANPAYHYALLVKQFLNESGITVRGNLYTGQAPKPAVLLTVFWSRELGEILKELNHYSNNFIAGQILYALGQDQQGFFRRDLGLKKISAALRESGVRLDGVELLDGSGLDKRNKMSAAALLSILLAGSRDFSIANDFGASLSRMGKNGTVKKRVLDDVDRVGVSLSELDAAKKRVASIWAKTGTLDGVSSLAGYLESVDRSRLAYVVIINGDLEKNMARKIEDNLLGIMIGLRR